MNEDFELYLRRLKLPFYYTKLFFLVAQCKLLLLAALVRNRFRTKRILTLPDKPWPHAALYKICHRLGYRITRNPNHRADLIIAWKDCTVRPPCADLERLVKQQRVINFAARDISKRHVAEVFEAVFGYSLQVDPQQQGAMVQKSNANAVKNARIISGPVEENREFAYQRLVRNEVDGYLQNIRAVVFGASIAYCLEQKVRQEHRFDLETGEAVIREVKEVFDPNESDTLQRFCRAMGLDYGELDVLRDADDGRVYVVDVNNTPFGPVSRRLQTDYWFDRTSWQALGRMCRAFDRAFIAQSPTPDLGQ